MKKILYNYMTVAFGLLFSQLAIAQCGPTSVTIDPQPIMTCAGDPATVNFTPSGTCTGNYEYEVLDGATVIQAWSTAASATVSPTTTTTYTVNVRCSACPANVISDVFTIDVLEQPTITGNQVICAGNTTSLNATVPSGNVEWWDAQAGGNQLSANGTYTTPALNSDQTYWVHISGTSSSGGGSILITECGLDGANGGTGSEDYIEVSNLYTTPINTTGWVVAVSASYTNINTFNSTLWNLPASFAPCSVVTRTDYSGSPNYWGNNIFWNSTSNSWAIIIDDQGNVVDFIAWGWTAAELASFNPTINGFSISLGTEWIGNGCALPCGSSGGVQYSFARTGSADSNTAGDFVCQPTSVDLVNPGLSCGWTVGTTCTYPVTVQVDQAPTASNPPTVNVECAGDVPAPDPLVVTDEADDFTAAPTVTHIGDVSNGLSCPEIITRTYRITDACGNYTDVTQTIIIDDLTPPTASNLPPVSISNPANIPPVNILDVTDEADNCGTANVFHVSDVSNGATCPEIITRTYSVTDACGNSINVTQTITIGDPVLPTASDPAPMSFECIGDVPTPDPLVVIDEADNGANPPIVTWEDDTSDGLSCPETIDRRYRVTDDCGNFIFVTQVITVNDVTAPVMDTPPAAINVQCIGDVPPMFNLGWTDNCDGTGTVAGTDSPLVGGTCGGTITRMWTYMDGCGNADTVYQTITVNDNIAPTANNLPSIVLSDYNLIPTPDPLDVTSESDNCTVNPVVAFISDVSDGNFCPEIITRTYSITDDCGNQTTVTQTITVGGTPPTLDAGPDQIICAGSPTSVTATNPTGAVLTWSGGISDGIAFTPGQTQVYTVVADNNGCINTDSLTITIEDLPVPSFVGDNLSGCSPLTVNLTSTTPGNLSNWAWSVGGQTLSGANPTVTLNPGTYDVTLAVLSSNGCPGQVTYTDYIYVEADPNASFIPSMSQTSIMETNIEFTNTSQGATNYTWDFGDNSSGSTSVNPIHQYPDDIAGAYTVQLIASSALGCTDTAYAVINIKDEMIYYLPNTFTPDGDDFNEYFQPVFTTGYDPYDFDFFIFNRWGEIIWESHDASVGWDGTYGVDGDLVQDGAYTWRLEFKTTMTDERVLVTGTVNLIR